MAINKKRLQGAAETTGLVPSENFEIQLYTGGSEATVTFDFAPDLIWIKSRGGAYDHILFDSVRGIDSTNEPYVRPNQALTEVTGTNRFSLSGDGKTMTIPVDSNINNTALGSPYVVWAWRCPDAFSHSASGSQLASSGKSNQAAGISIVSYTGNDTVGATVKHNLGVKPELIIFKARTRDNNWGVYASAITADKFLSLNTTDVATDALTPFNDTEPDATVFTLGNSLSFNNAGTMIAYCFVSVAGYSKVGTYEGTSAAGNSVDCGFEPAFLMLKNIDDTGHWIMIDNKRTTTNPRGKTIYANENAGEGDLTGAGFPTLDFTTTGFILQNPGTLSGDVNMNINNETYIFYAIAADPDTTSPTLAKSFNVDAYTGNGATQQIGSVNTLFTKYAVFNGSSSYMTIPTIGKTRTQSFSFWFRTNTTSTSALLSSNGGSSSNKGVLILFESGGNVGKIRLQIAGGTGSINFERTSGAYNDGQWHHLVAAYDCTSAGDNTFLYIDGLLILDFNSNQWSSGTSTNDVHMGANNTSGSESFKGQIDQFRVYNAVLTASQVTELYNETATTASTLNYPTGAGCLALYEFNDNADDTGNNYDGTIANETYDSFLFKPDLVIIKNRDANDGWRWFDTQRGVLNRLESSATSAAANLANSLTAFNNAGFTVGSEATVNTSGEDYVSFSLKMLDNNNNVPVENTVGTIKSLTSVNANAGMSIAKYIGNGTQNATIGHGLTSAPDMVIIKNLDQNDSWFVSHSGLSSNQFVEFTTGAATTNSDLNHERLSTTFKTTSASPHHMINTSGENYIMYSFITTSTFSHFGSYNGDNGTDRLFNIGFAANFVMVKKSNGDSNWQTFDSIRGGNAQIDFNSDAAEFTGGSTPIEFVSNGFKIKSNYTTYNATGGEYIYWAMKIN